MYQDKDKYMLFTNKIVYFRRKKVQNFRLRTLIMIFDRLPQVSSGQYKSSLIRHCQHDCYKVKVIIVPTKYVIATRYRDLEENIIFKMQKCEIVGSLALLARNHL